MWRTIDMSNNTGHDFPDDTLETMCRHAIDRSRGNLVDINVEYLGTKELLKHITDNSSSGISGLPQYVRVIGRSCPLLKSFRLKRMWYDIFDHYKWHDENATAIAETMPGLSHLQLWGNELTNVRWPKEDSGFLSSSRMA
ncbi:hypothetical protein M0R45_013696 [Rubus argutus]|uniref:Uncharacterized protein n=1 Tax=Rubus argutus TaxID=59490 RepID=A0AAW1XJX0_RUBAR